MKSALLLSAFLILVGVLTGTRPAVEGGEELRVNFDDQEAQSSVVVKEVRIKDTGKNIIIELDDLQPKWASKALPNVSFTVKPEHCQFIATEPVLFRCEAAPVAKTKAYGVKLELLKLESTSFTGHKISDLGGVVETELYAVDFNLKVGRKPYTFRAFADPKAVEAIALKEAKAVAQKSNQ